MHSTNSLCKAEALDWVLLIPDMWTHGCVYCVIIIHSCDVVATPNTTLLTMPMQRMMQNKYQRELDCWLVECNLACILLMRHYTIMSYFARMRSSSLPNLRG
jgi:hypothetical protein